MIFICIPYELLHQIVPFLSKETNRICWNISQKQEYFSVKKKKWTGLDNTKAVPFLSSFFLPALTFCWLTVLQYNWIIEHRMVAYIFKLCPKWEIKGLNPAQHWSMSFRTDWESISLCSGGWSSWALQFAHLCFQRDFICSRQLCWAL